MLFCFLSLFCTGSVPRITRESIEPITVLTDGEFYRGGRHFQQACTTFESNHQDLARSMKRKGILNKTANGENYLYEVTKSPTEVLIPYLHDLSRFPTKITFAQIAGIVTSVLSPLCSSNWFYSDLGDNRKSVYIALQTIGICCAILSGFASETLIRRWEGLGEETERKVDGILDVCNKLVALHNSRENPTDCFPEEYFILDHLRNLITRRPDVFCFAWKKNLIQLERNAIKTTPSNTVSLENSYDSSYTKFKKWRFAVSTALAINVIFFMLFNFTDLSLIVAYPKNFSTNSTERADSDIPSKTILAFNILSTVSNGINVLFSIVLFFINSQLRKYDMQNNCFSRWLQFVSEQFPCEENTKALGTYSARSWAKGSTARGTTARDTNSQSALRNQRSMALY